MESAEKFKRVERFQQTLEGLLKEIPQSSQPNISALTSQIQSAVAGLAAEIEGKRPDPSALDAADPGPDPGPAQALLQRIHGLQQDLQAALDRVSMSGDDKSYQTLRTALRGMIRAYSDFKLRFEERPIESMSVKNGSEISLCAALKQAAVREVFQWKEWTYLLQNVTRGEIDLPTRQNGTNGVEDPLLARKKPIQVRRTDDFFPAFRRSLERLESQTRSEIERSVQLWLEELQRSVQPFQEQVASVVRDWGMARSNAEQKLGEEGEYWVNVLQIAIQPKSRQELTVNRAFDGAPPLKAEEFFPLALSKSPTIPGRAFGWDPELRDQNRPSPEPSRHPSHVYRMRDEMITSLAMAQGEIAGQALSLAAQSIIRDTCAMLIQTLDEALSRPSILSAVIPGSGSKSSMPTGMEVFQRIAREPIPSLND
jgi:hypothetical protein